MQKFAATCALAGFGAQALELQAEKGTLILGINSWEAEVVSMPQGNGQDHTLWSWNEMMAQAQAQVRFYEKLEKETRKKFEDVQRSVDTFRTTFTSYDTLYAQTCENYRNEELNLYYQCTQLDYNNYALDHYGGDMRSYPRWTCEYCICNNRLREAQHVLVEGRWCKPSTYQPYPEMCFPCGPDPVPYNEHPEPEAPTIEKPFKYDLLPDFGGYWIMRPQSSKEPINALSAHLVQSGKCIMQEEHEVDWETVATLTSFKVGSNTPVEINQIRLVDNDYIEATIGPGGGLSDYDTKIMPFGYAEVNEQNVHQHHYEEGQTPYHPDMVYFTKVGSCTRRGPERLWSFTLYPKVEKGLVGDINDQAFIDNYNSEWYWHDETYGEGAHDVVHPDETPGEHGTDSVEVTVTVSE